MHPNVRDDNRNFFKVYWSGDYPRNDIDGNDGNSCAKGACASLPSGGCLCNTTVIESIVFTSMPSSIDEVLSKLYIGGFDPSAYDEGTFVEYSENGITAYLLAGKFSTKSLFKVTDKYGRIRLLKNAKETVQIDNGLVSFRSAPSFMSMINDEATKRDAMYEGRPLCCCR